MERILTQKLNLPKKTNTPKRDCKAIDWCLTVGSDRVLPKLFRPFLTNNNLITLKFESNTKSLIK
jgi:hypothetical protein